MINQSIRFILVCLLFMSVNVHSFAQNVQQHLQRAESLNERIREIKISRDNVKLKWNNDKTCWFLVNTGTGSSSNSFECFFVDPAKGQKTLLFDTAKIKSQIDSLNQGPATFRPEQLTAILRDKQNSSNFHLKIRKNWWLWDAKQHSLSPLAKERVDETIHSQQETPRASLTTGPETFVRFINRTRSDAHLQWIDQDGKAKGYGHIQPGKERRQHTFSGHVWRVFDDQGNDLAWVEADDHETEVEISTTKPTPNSTRNNSDKNTSAKETDKKQSSLFKIADHNIHIRKTTQDSWKPLTTDGTKDLFYRGPLVPSPDGRFLVAVKSRAEVPRLIQIIESSPTDQLQPKTISIPYLKPGDQIEHKQPVLFDLTTDKQINMETGLFDNPWNIDDFHWAEDSTEFFFLYNQRGHQAVRLVGINPANGKARTIAEEKFDTFVDYPNKIWHHWLPGSKSLLWMSERSGFNHLYLIDVLKASIDKQLTSGEFVVRKVEKVDDQSGIVWLLAGGVHSGQDPYYQHLVKAHIDGSAPVFMTQGDGNHTITFSPQGDFFLDRYSRVDMPPVHELRSAHDGKLIAKLAEATLALPENNRWHLPERFSAKGRDGKTEIYGVIYKPTHFDPSKKYPVVEEIYAGPHGAHVPKSWGLHLRQQKMAELGFIVVQIDGMGTNWRSKSFHDVASRNLADAGFPDRKAWLKAAASTRPWMDLSRVGIYGGSAGGQNAMRALIDHHDFYRVAVADCGCHDNRMDKIWWNELWLGWPVGDQYEKNSNTVHAGRMQGKLMLIVGELDRNVDPASTMQVVNALVKSNKDFELVVIPGAGHGSAETPYGSRKRAEFLIQNLLQP